MLKVTGRGGNTIVPNWIWTCGLSSQAIHLAGFLLSHTEAYLAGVTLRSASRATGMAVPTIRRCAHELAELGLATVIPGTGRGTAVSFEIDRDRWDRLTAEQTLRGVQDLTHPRARIDTPSARDLAHIEEQGEDQKEVVSSTTTRPSGKKDPTKDPANAEAVAIYQHWVDWWRSRPGVDPESFPTALPPGACIKTIGGLLRSRRYTPAQIKHALVDVAHGHGLMTTASIELLLQRHVRTTSTTVERDDVAYSTSYEGSLE